MLRHALTAVVGLLLLTLFCVHARRNYLACYTGGGDSPHYLLMARSLARDGDLKLRPEERSLESNYEDFPIELDTRIFSEERPYSIHPVGAPIFFAPAYALAGRQGVLFELALLSAMAAFALWRYLTHITGDHAAAGLVTLAAALSVPFVPLIANEYTEMPALYVELTGLMLAAHVAGRPEDRITLFLLGLAVGVLPWIHVRYAPIGAALAGAAFLRAEPRFAARAWLIAPAAALLAGLYAWGWHATGAFSLSLPMTLSGGNAASGLSASVLVTKGLLGHLVDQQGGLLVHAPHYALAALGFPVIYQRYRGEALLHLAYALPTLLIVGSYPNWSGHWGVPCRFLVVLVPGLSLALVPVARAALDRGAAGLLAVAPLLAWSLAVAGAMLRWPPLQLSLEAPDVNLGAVFVHLYRETGVQLVSAIPRFIYTPRARDYALALAILIVLAAWLRLAKALIERADRARVGRAALLAAVAIAVWLGAAAHMRSGPDPLSEDGRWAELDTEHLLHYPRFYEMLANKAMTKGRPDVARRALERVLEVHPRYAPAYAQMATVAVRRDEQKLWAERGLAVIDDPAVQVPDRLFWRGLLHAMLGQSTEALADLTDYLRQPGLQQPAAQQLVRRLSSAPGTGR